MSNDYITAILCIGFTVGAIAVLVYALFRRDLAGTDEECSAAVLDADEAVPMPAGNPSKRKSRWMGLALIICMSIITSAIVLTLVVASQAATGGVAKCPFF